MFVDIVIFIFYFLCMTFCIQLNIVYSTNMLLLAASMGHQCDFGYAASHTLFPFKTKCVSVFILPPKSANRFD